MVIVIDNSSKDLSSFLNQAQVVWLLVDDVKPVQIDLNQDRLPESGITWFNWTQSGSGKLNL